MKVKQYIGIYEREREAGADEMSAGITIIKALWREYSQQVSDFAHPNPAGVLVEMEDKWAEVAKVVNAPTALFRIGVSAMVGDEGAALVSRVFRAADAERMRIRAAERHRTN